MGLIWGSIFIATPFLASSRRMVCNGTFSTIRERFSPSREIFNSPALLLAGKLNKNRMISSGAMWDKNVDFCNLVLT